MALFSMMLFWKLYLHLLSNGGIFLEKKININVKVTDRDAPCHTTNNLGYNNNEFEMMCQRQISVQKK